MQNRLGSGCDLHPRADEVRDDDAPRDTIDDEVVGHDDHAALNWDTGLGVQPDELQHNTIRRIEAVECGVDLGIRHGGQVRVRVEHHAVHERVDIDRTGLGDPPVPRPVGPRCQRHAQRIVVVDHCRDRRDDTGAINSQRHLQRRKLVEPAPLARPFDHPAE